MRLTGDEKFVFVPYEIKVSTYPPFCCGIIFIKPIRDVTAEFNAGQAAPIEEKTQDEKSAADKAKVRTAK